MPYIHPATRDLLQPTLRETPANAGALNYCFTKIIDDYLVANGLSYSRINEVIGALECCKLELYRRVAAPYEETKIEANGDVYSEKLLTKPETKI